MMRERRAVTEDRQAAADNKQHDNLAATGDPCSPHRGSRANGDNAASTESSVKYFSHPKQNKYTLFFKYPPNQDTKTSPVSKIFQCKNGTRCSRLIH